MTYFYFLLACVILSSSVFADQPAHDESDRVPASAAEFHDMESQRYHHWFEGQRDRFPALDYHLDYDVTYYELFFDTRNFLGHIITANTRIVATCESSSLSTLTLSLCQTLIVDSVIIAGGPRAFVQTASNLLETTLDHTYTTGELIDARVYYHGSPCQANGAFSWYTRTVNGNPVYAVHTLSEPEGSEDWWPNKNFPDDKADSVRVAILCSDTLTGTSNGLLESVVIVPPSSKRFTWIHRYPISSYLVTINVTNYAFYQDWYVAQNGDSVPLDHYPYPERLSQALVGWNPLPGMITHLADLFGEYPFVNEKYGHTMFNFSGAMEHQTNTSYGRSITNGSHTYDYIVVHELGHQWWGDDVTLETWPDVWLNEGFASYCEALWWEHVAGFDSLSGYMTSPAGNEVVDPSGPVYNPTYLFSGNDVYDKGSWILHMLRGVIRDDSVFYAAMAEYRNRHEYGAANTVEFLDAASDVAGFDVTPYLGPYLYMTDRPSLQRSFGSGVVDGVTRTVVRINQVQVSPVPLFRTRLDLKFTGGGSALYTVENYLQRSRYYYDLGFAPTTLTIDPDDWVLKLVINATLPPTILNTSLSAGEVGQNYADTMEVIGGSGTPTWTVVSGALPLGIAMPTTGILSGIPTVAGDFSVSIRVSRTGGADTMAYVISIVPPLLAPDSLTIQAVNESVVRLDWTAVATAESYRVWRATLADLSDRALIASTTLLTHTDSTATVDGTTPLAIRFYEVTAIRNP